MCQIYKDVKSKSTLNKAFKHKIESSMDLEALNPLAFGSAAGSQETMSKSVFLHDLDYVLVLEHVPLAHASGFVLHA